MATVYLLGGFWVGIIVLLIIGIIVAKTSSSTAGKITAAAFITTFVAGAIGFGVGYTGAMFGPGKLRGLGSAGSAGSTAALSGFLAPGTGIMPPRYVPRLR